MVRWAFVCSRIAGTISAFASHPKSQPPAITSLRATSDTLDKSFLRESLPKNSLFQKLPEESLASLIDAFEPFRAARRQAIVTQGDPCADDYVYVIADGSCKVRVDGKNVPKPYGTIGSGTLFGELGVLYNETRRATVLCESESATLFRIAAASFRTIMEIDQREDLERMREIDRAIDQVSGTGRLYEGGDIIPQYKPQAEWLWRQWSGTIVKISFRTVLGNMLLCLAINVWVQHASGADYHHYFWTADGVVLPDKDLPLVRDLSLISKIWGYQRTLTTFVLTFFVNRAFGFWKDIYADTRKIQNSIDGYFLLLSTNVKRNDDGTLTQQSIELLEDVGQYSRVFHALYWASMAKRFQVLGTDLGLQRMASRGMITRNQLRILQSLDVTDQQLKLAPLEWMLIRPIRAMEEGVVAGDTATKGQLLKQMGKLRDSYMAIPDKLAGRMPLAYTQFVQILVDTYVLIAPFALYAELGAYAIVAVGLITLFYTGLLNLAKIFLDPLNNENYCEADANFLDLGVLIRESNGASTRWRRVGEKLPFE